MRRGFICREQGYTQIPSFGIHIAYEQKWMNHVQKSSTLLHTRRAAVTYLR